MYRILTWVYRQAVNIQTCDESVLLCGWMALAMVSNAAAAESPPSPLGVEVGVWGSPFVSLFFPIVAKVVTTFANVLRSVKTKENGQLPFQLGYLTNRTLGAFSLCVCVYTSHVFNKKEFLDVKDE